MNGLRVAALVVVLLALAAPAAADIGPLSADEDAADLVLERADWSGFFRNSPRFQMPAATPAHGER